MLKRFVYSTILFSSFFIMYFPCALFGMQQNTERVLTHGELSSVRNPEKKHRYCPAVSRAALVQQLLDRGTPKLEHMQRQIKKPLSVSQ